MISPLIGAMAVVASIFAAPSQASPAWVERVGSLCTVALKRLLNTEQPVRTVGMEETSLYRERLFVAIRRKFFSYLLMQGSDPYFFADLAMNLFRDHEFDGTQNLAEFYLWIRQNNNDPEKTRQLINEINAFLDSKHGVINVTVDLGFEQRLRLEDQTEVPTRIYWEAMVTFSRDGITAISTPSRSETMPVAPRDDSAVASFLTNLQETLDRAQQSH